PHLRYDAAGEDRRPAALADARLVDETGAERGSQRGLERVAVRDLVADDREVRPGPIVIVGRIRARDDVLEVVGHVEAVTRRQVVVDAHRRIAVVREGALLEREAL